MKAKIKSFHSPDIEDLNNFIPVNPENFSFLLELMVGPDNEEGEESFTLQVCTPQWLLSAMKKEDVLCGNHLLIVLEYQFEHIFKKVKRLIEACCGDSWKEIADKVARIAHWEFEDYVE